MRNAEVKAWGLEHRAVASASVPNVIGSCRGQNSDADNVIVGFIRQGRIQQLVSPPLPKIRLRRGWEGIKGRVITPTQTPGRLRRRQRRVNLPHQGGGLLAKIQGLLNPPEADL
jgi:hypothetical protein